LALFKISFPRVAGKPLPTFGKTFSERGPPKKLAPVKGLKRAPYKKRTPGGNPQRELAPKGVEKTPEKLPRGGNHHQVG